MGTGGAPIIPPADAAIDARVDASQDSADGNGPLVCGADLADCNKDTRDGCEASLDSNLNCGRCGNTCQAPNATAACVNRVCGPLTCAAGFGDCNGNRVDGCETALDGDANCGACARKCATPTPYCGLTNTARVCQNPVAVLVDQRIEAPCTGVLEKSTELCASQANPAVACPDAGVALRRTLTAGGRTGVIYNVTLHIRGVVEPRIYAGGRGPGDHFYVGGTVGKDSGYNTYSLTVSSPAQTYYFNYDEAKGEDHYVFTLDHQKTIQIAGGATLKLEMLDPDCAMVKNCQSFATTTCQPFLVPGIPPAPAGYNGQFVHFDVVDVVSTQ